MTTEDARLERWERRLAVQMAAVPYLLLAVSLGVYWLGGDHAPSHRLATLGLAAAAAAWIWFGTRWPWKPLYVAGLVVFIAVLGWRAIWFASFFGFVGYLHSWRYLNGRWRLVGVAATAAVSVAVYSGGPPEADPADILGFLLLLAAIVAVVALFSVFGDITLERSAERRRMVTRLEEALEENAGLQAQLLVQAREAGVLDERQRIAAEIHDTLAQGLTGIIAHLQAAGHVEDWRGHVDQAIDLARRNLAEARRTVHAVGPAQLEAAPLPDALGEILEQWSEGGGVRAELTVTGTVRPMHPEVEGALLRIAQESLANIAAHARASRAGLTLSYMEDVVVLDVRDDGAGFDPGRARQSGGFGLESMRRRAERLGGDLAVESRPQEGTAISASVPVLPLEDTHA